MLAVLGSPMPWTFETELAATAVEIAFETYRVLLLANGVKRSRVPRSLRIPRPSGSTQDKPVRRHASSVQDVVAVMNAGHRKG